MAAVLNHSRSSGTAKVVLLGIANHAGDGGAWPTIATLARYANVTERNVQKAIGQLLQLGEVSVERQAGGLAYLKNSERPNRYEVLVRCPQTCDGTVNHRLRTIATPSQLVIDAPGLPQSDPVTPATPGVGSDTPPGVGSDTHNHPSNPATIASVVTEPQTARVAASPEVQAAAIAAVRDDLAARRANR